ncbi:MAG: hypothetical protein Kilf2KO_29870 [Rhodospirillales bacterium]
MEHVLDFHGTGVTPGHFFLRGDGTGQGKHRPVIEILVEDGALVRADGTLVRASTNCPVGSELDRKVKVLWTSAPRPRNATSLDPEALTWTEGYVRLGTRYLRDDGEFPTVADFLEAQGYSVTEEGLVDRHDGMAPTPLHEFGGEPRPEAYVLARSGLTLEEIMGTPESLDDEVGYAVAASRAQAAGESPLSPGSDIRLGSGYTPPEGLAALGQSKRRH